MSELDYHLPPAAIAQRPVEPRSSARLLDATDPGGALGHHLVRDLPELLHPGDLLVVNDTRVMPARLRLRKSTGALVEVLLLEPAPNQPAPNQPAPNQPAPDDQPGALVWEALVRRSRRVPAGTLLYEPVGGDPPSCAEPVAEVGEVLAADGRRLMRLLDARAVARNGEVALPPYVRQPLDDPERYQTVYARRPVSVAAPTAGLHLDGPVLSALAAKGVGIASVELAVGLATFQPVKTELAGQHELHSEAYSVPEATMDACTRARRVVAVGTTAVRALESAAATGELSGRTSLFIHGSYQFRVVDVLLTNFHMPRSSLLLLLDAFMGPRWRAVYEAALASGYRFLSFGDAMLAQRADRGESRAAGRAASETTGEGERQGPGGVAARTGRASGQSARGGAAGP